MQISHEPESIIQVFNKIYCYHLDEAEAALNAITPGEVDQNLLDLTRVNLHWWYLISGDDHRDHEKILSDLLERMTEQYQDREPDQLNQDEIFLVVHAYAYRTRIHIFEAQYLRGAVYLNKTLGFLNVALSNYKKYDKYAFLAGLYHYFAAAAYDYYPLLRSFFLLAPKSNKELGYRLLNECRQLANPLLNIESSYFLMKINLELEENFTAALNFINPLVEKYPENLIYHLHKMMIHMELNQLTPAQSEYRKIKQLSQTLPGLNPSQRTHIIKEANRFLEKRKIRPFI